MSGACILVFTLLACGRSLNGPRLQIAFGISAGTVLFAVFSLLLPFINAGFVADDFYFADSLRRNLAWWSDWGHAVTPGVGGFRPIASLSYDIDRSFNVSPWSFRLSNYCLHSAASIAFGTLLFSLSRSRLLAILFSLLFAVYPVHHENVVWISGRTYLLGGVFGLLGLVVVQTRRGAGGLLVGSILTFAAIGSHESFLVLPIIAFLLVKDRARSCQVFALSALIFLVCRSLTVGSSLIVGWERVPQNILGMSARLLTLPRDQYLSPDYCAPVFVLTVAVVLCWGVANQNRIFSKPFLAAVSAASVACLPFVIFPGYADRFLYFPSALFLLCLTRLFSVEPLRNESVRPQNLYGLIAGFCLMFPVWSLDFISHARDWYGAGEISQKIIEQASDEVTAASGSQRLSFEGLPLMFGRAYVFMTHFDTALQSECSKRGITWNRAETPQSADVRLGWSDEQQKFSPVKERRQNS